MDQFERQFENLDVQTEFVEQAMSNTTAATTPVAGLHSLPGSVRLVTWNILSNPKP
jgi:hypothetical protein